LRAKLLRRSGSRTTFRKEFPEDAKIASALSSQEPLRRVTKSSDKVLISRIVYEVFLGAHSLGVT
jgi:hypothetical protein